MAAANSSTAESGRLHPWLRALLAGPCALGLAALPGLALGVAGRWSDFLIWIGAAAILGWALTSLTNMRPKSRTGPQG